MKDKVTPEVHDAVLKRDGACIVSKLDVNHVCRDQWGRMHSPNDLSKLTLDHVHDGGGVLGKRAPSDALHLVTICAKVNIDGPSRTIRQAEREYLAGL